MGHYWREMDPEGAEKHDRLMARCSQIQKELENVPLGLFMASELEPLMTVLGLARNSVGVISPSDEDFKVIEERLSKINA